VIPSNAGKYWITIPPDKVLWLLQPEKTPRHLVGA
jgi:hypothetical protein